MTDVYSDEPDRVSKITSTIFTNQSGNWSTDVGDATIGVTIGADRRDDCAVFDVRGDVDIVAGSDYVRGPKFTLYELGLMSLYDLGYYLAAANLSDVAAMGAKPIGLLSVVRYPPEMSDAEFTSVLEGIRDACIPHGVLNVGGDIGSAERLILSASAIGACRPGSALARSGARPGDLVAVSGPTGVAGAALVYFRDVKPGGGSLAADVEARLLDAWRRPQAQIGLGRYLSESGVATACQDTSDGLKATIDQIAAASRVGILIDESSVPIDPCVAAVAQVTGADVLSLTFGGSVDFRLLFTVRSEERDALETSEFGQDIHIIGNVNDGGQTQIRHLDGRVGRLPGVAWRHQEPGGLGPEDGRVDQ